MAKPKKAVSKGDGDYSPFMMNLTGKLTKNGDQSRLMYEDNNTLVIDNFSELINIRYTDNGVRGVRGMSKINSTVLPYPKVRAAHQYVKSQPAESHIVAQAFNSGETESKVYKNDSVIPATGDFNGTELHTDASGAGTGRFSDSPLGRLIYCNGKETMVWGGDESTLSNFTVYDPDGSFSYDFTEKIQNTLSDSLNRAKLYQSTAGDTNADLLLHLNNNLTNDGSGFGTVSETGGVTYTTASKFGSHAASLNGSSRYISCTHHAAQDYSGGTFTFSAWLRPTTYGGGIFSQALGAATSDYINFYIDANGAIVLSVVQASSEVVSMSTVDAVLPLGTFTHVELVESGNDWYIFVNGAKKAYTSDSNRTEGAAAYDTAFYLGVLTDGTTLSSYFDGRIDEIRSSNVEALHTDDFEPQASEYGSNPYVNIRIGNILPIDAIIWTLQTVNTTAGSVSIFYWNGSAWTAVSGLVDGTAVTGVPLAQNGSMTFDSTESTAKQKIIDGVAGFWYLIRIESADTSTRVSNVTVREPFQLLQDIWDNETRVLFSVQYFESSVYNDNTYNVLNDSYLSLDESTFMKLPALITSEYVVIGSFERLQGLVVKIVPGSGNTANASLDIKYWQGNKYTSIGTVNDGTNQNNKSFAASGLITWSPLAELVEFRREVNQSESLYFYKLSWSATLSADSKIYHISGIPVQQPISNYKFALHAQDRLMLFNDQSGMKNSMLSSVQGTLNVFNGKDSGDPILFGDGEDVTAAVEVFTKLTTGIVSDILVMKTNAVFLLTGGNPEDWTQTQLSSEVGCPSPLTLRASPIGLEHSPLQSRQVAIWQSNNGIMLYDSNSIYPISDSISDFFDQTKSYAVNLSALSVNYAFWDNTNGNYEYHWCFASGSNTVPDKELVFDLRRQKWYEVNRGTGKALMGGVPVIATGGARYTYGFTNDGYLERLENGTTFDGNSIAYTMEFGDIAPFKYPMYDSIIRYLRMFNVAKETTTNTVTVTHYADMNNTGVDISMSMSRTGYRVSNPVNSIPGHKWPKAAFHRLKFNVSTNDETIGFEPLYISGFIKYIGESID